MAGPGVRAWGGLEVGVGVNSRGEGLQLTDSKLLVRRYQWDQPEFSVRCLLYGVDAIILRLGGGGGGLRQYLLGSNWFLDIDLGITLNWINPKLISGCLP